MSNEIRTVRAVGPAAEPLPGDDQALLHNDLIAVMTRDIPIAHMLDVVAVRPGGSCGMRAGGVQPAR